MAESSNAVRVSGVAERYASALFDLALSENRLDEVASDLGDLDTMLNGSDDLQRLVRSPVFSVEQQGKAMNAVLAKAKIGGTAANFIRVVAANRRLFALPGMIASFREKRAAHRGEASADVRVAHKLTPDQTKQLKATLKGVVGKDVALEVTVDPSLLGGMVVKVGSRQIDTSLKTKLASMKQALKEVG